MDLTNGVSRPEATRADAEDQLEDIDGWKKPRSLFHDMPSTKTTEDQAKLSETSDHEISDDEDDEVITRESMKSGGLNGSKLALERKLDKEMTTKNDNAKVRDFGKGRGTNGKLIEIDEDEDEGEKSYPPPKDHRSQSSTKGLPDECHECGEPGGRGDPLTRCIAIRCEIATHFGEECSGDDGVPNKGWLCPKHAKLKADATMLSKKSKKHVRAPSPEIHIPAKKARRDESMLLPPRPGKSRRQTPVTRVSDTPSPREPYRSTRTRR